MEQIVGAGLVPARYKNNLYSINDFITGRDKPGPYITVLGYAHLMPLPTSKGAFSIWNSTSPSAEYGLGTIRQVLGFFMTFEGNSVKNCLSPDAFYRGEFFLHPSKRQKKSVKKPGRSEAILCRRALSDLSNTKVLLLINFFTPSEVLQYVTRVQLIIRAY